VSFNAEKVPHRKPVVLIQQITTISSRFAKIFGLDNFRLYSKTWGLTRQEKIPMSKYAMEVQSLPERKGNFPPGLGWNNRRLARNHDRPMVRLGGNGVPDNDAVVADQDLLNQQTKRPAPPPR
jgi:hypothetical protein